MITERADGPTMLKLVEQVSLAGRGGVSPRVLLERVCSAVAKTFEHDCVMATRFHPGAEELSEIAAYGGIPAEEEGRRAIAGSPLLVRARESQSLVLVAGDDRPERDKAHRSR